MADQAVLAGLITAGARYLNFEVDGGVEWINTSGSSTVEDDSRGFFVIAGFRLTF